MCFSRVLALSIETDEYVKMSLFFPVFCLGQCMCTSVLFVSRHVCRSLNISIFTDINPSIEAAGCISVSRVSYKEITEIDYNCFVMNTCGPAIAVMNRRYNISLVLI